MPMAVVAEVITTGSILGLIALGVPVDVRIL